MTAKQRAEGLRERQRAEAAVRQAEAVAAIGVALQEWVDAYTTAMADLGHSLARIADALEDDPTTLARMGKDHER